MEGFEGKEVVFNFYLGVGFKGKDEALTSNKGKVVKRRRWF